MRASLSGILGSVFVLSLASCGSTGSGNTGIGQSGGAGGQGAFGGSGAVGGFGGIGGGSAAGGGPSGSCAEAEASKSYVGCDFWPTVTANAVWYIFDFAVVVANAGSTPADIFIEGRGGSRAGTVQPGGLEKFFLPWIPELKGGEADTCGGTMPINETIRSPGGAYHLTSTVPVTVYQFNALEYKGAGGPPGKDWSACPGNQICADTGMPTGCFSFTNDASLLLPSTATTGTYRVAGVAGIPGGPLGGPSLNAYFSVTGLADGTTVNVTLPAGVQIAPGGGLAQAGNTLSFPIARGEVVQVVGGNGSDVSGSLVSATLPVQVISGIPCIQSPAGTPACDHVEESIFPAETLGQHYFVTVPTGALGNVVGHQVRIYGNIDGTTLTYPGFQPPMAPATINAGQVVDLGVVAQDFEVVGSASFSVGSIMVGGQLQDPTGGKGDPSMSFATAVEQYRTGYIFLAPDDYDVSYVDIAMPDGTSVTIDGAQATGMTFPISSGFSVLRAQLGAGNLGAHTLSSTAPVGIQVMGFGLYTSYQYPGGSDLTLIAPPPPK